MQTQRDLGPSEDPRGDPRKIRREIREGPRRREVPSGGRGRSPRPPSGPSEGIRGILPRNGERSARRLARWGKATACCGSPTRALRGIGPRRTGNPMNGTERTERASGTPEDGRERVGGRRGREDPSEDRRDGTRGPRGEVPNPPRKEGRGGRDLGPSEDPRGDPRKIRREIREGPRRREVPSGGRGRSPRPPSGPSEGIRGILPRNGERSARRLARWGKATACCGSPTRALRGIGPRRTGNPMNGTERTGGPLGGSSGRSEMDQRIEPSVERWMSSESSESSERITSARSTRSLDQTDS